ncbi:MAG: efflux transporter outer membrane subunit [Dysgonamonadaceae bacterium]|nr:efflux transporter outer membrane subunit [Dysgonamonadaceae bacterium]
MVYKVKNKFRVLVPFFICGIIFTSCKVGRPYKAPEMNIPQSFGICIPDSGSITVADIGWSTLYTDTVLQKLIDKALVHNKDVLISVAGIKEMIAGKRIGFANQFPALGIDGLTSREHLDYGGNTPRYTSEVHAKATLSWEIDIWGKLRWTNDAAIAAYMQSVEAQQALRLTIVAGVAQTYFELIALDRELEIVKQTVAARKQAVHFAKIRYEGGQTSEIPYRQSQVELARTESLIPKLENSIKVKENDLSLLLGEFPSLIVRGAGLRNQQMPSDLPVDLPSSLLKRRPDIRAAEQKLIEVNARVGIALAEMFPSINLGGTLGAENSEFVNFLKSPEWFISGALTGPIFNMGKNRAKHKASQAVYEQVTYDYEKRVLLAFNEVYNAIITFKNAKEIRKSKTRLYDSSLSYQELAGLQYINGIVSYIDVLDAQRQLFDAEISLNDAILNELISTVLLYKALGGGVNK